MKVGAFTLQEPLPELHSPHAFVILRPWLDAGSAGRAAINMLEKTFKTEKLAKLSRPGNFFDFTRYRPITSKAGEERHISVPNTYINYAVRPGDNDMVFMHLLEPHYFSELYIDSIVKLLQTLGVTRFCVMGSMYDAVPHTRPLSVSGLGDKEILEKLKPLHVRESNYEGPTSISFLINEKAGELGIETLTFVVHLPQYTRIEEDHNGHLRLMEILCALYDFPIDLTALRKKAEMQYRAVDHEMEKNPRVLNAVQYFESLYEARKNKPDEKASKLSPEIESFLNELDKNFQ